MKVMKRIYKQPITDVTIIRVTNLMLSVSNGGTPPDEGSAHAPGRLIYLD